MFKQKPKENLFPGKLKEILNNKDYEFIIKQGQRKNSIQICDLKSFEEKILPFFFRHNNFESFIRQMNHYGFKKDRYSKMHQFVNSELKSLKQLPELQSRNQKKRNKINNRSHITPHRQIYTENRENVNDLSKNSEKKIKQQEKQNQTVMICSNKNKQTFDLFDQNMVQYYWFSPQQLQNQIEWQQWQIMCKNIAFNLFNQC